MIKHYEGPLGTFDYDDEEFEVHSLPNYIHYIGKGLSVDFPKGCIKASSMFDGCTLPKGFTLGNFDTSQVTDMAFMFNECKLPEGFSLGDNFDTSNVVKMYGMFSSCVMPEGFSLGKKFNTSRVEDMSYMFSYCKLPKNFSLGNNFNTFSVKYTQGMFQECELPPEISKYEDPCDIVSWLKVPTKPEVWRILNQGLYEEEFYPQAEKIYDCVKYLVCTCGNITVDGKNVPAMRVLFDMWNNYSNETFKILEALVHESESDSAPQQMNLF